MGEQLPNYVTNLQRRTTNVGCTKLSKNLAPRFELLDKQFWWNNHIDRTRRLR
jgi:hypothetical protein